MASTFTTLGIEKMATGENAGTWGDKTNTNLDIVNTAISGYVEQAVTSGSTLALSITDGAATATAQNAVIKLTGTITGNSIVTVPDSVEKVYIVTNGTSGAYTVQFKTASGTGVTFGVSEKTTKLLYSDGTNIVDAGFGGAADMEGRELVLDADGDTTITADTDDQIDIKIAGADDFQFTANTFTAQSGSSIVVPESGLTFGSTAITSTAAELNLLDGVSGLVQADFTKLAGVDSTAAELNIVDGGTSATSTTVADADRVVLNDNGTMVQVAVTDLAAYFDDEITAMPNLTSVGTLTTLTVDNVIVNGTTIGHTSDTDLITLADGVATVAGEISVTTLDIGGTNVTSTAAELNILDGVTSTAAELNLLAGKAATNLALIGKQAGTNFSNSLIIGHTTTGTLNGSNDNVGVGFNSLQAITSGDSNTGVGRYTFGNLTTGSNNTAVGQQALRGINTESGNTAVGDNALRDNSCGAENTAIGHDAGYANTGNNNIFVGHNSGDNITSGSGNVVIGEVDAGSATGDRQLVIAGYDGTTTTTWISGDNSGNLTFAGDVTVGDDLNLTTDSSVINFGADSDTTLTHTDGTGLTLNSTNKLCFNDATQFIQGASGTVLDIAATDEIELTATLIDVVGNATVSGTLGVTGAITSSAGATITTADNTDTLSLISTDADANSGPNLRMYRNSSSPADSDLIGNMQFEGRNDNSQDVVYGEISARANDVSDGTEDGLIFIKAMTAGTLTEYMRFDPGSSGIIINDGSADLDFRVETNAEANAFKIDGGSETAAFGVPVTFNDAANVAQEAITSSSNAVAWDATDKPNAYHLTTENTTFSAPSNAVEGAFICLEINYNGSHTIAFNTVFEFAASTAPTTTDTDGKTDILVFRYNGAVWQEVGRTLNLAES
jgi:hypothetical protein